MGVIDELKPYLEDYINETARKSRGENKYVCPFSDCQSGTHRHGTGAFTLSPGYNRFKCFSCGREGDIVDYYQELHGVDRNTAIKELCTKYGIGNNTDIGSRAERKPPKPAPKPKEEPKEEPLTDYTEFFKDAISHITETDYPQKRGLSDAVIKKFGLGYAKNWKHPKSPYMSTSPRLIIPTSRNGYTARYTGEGKFIYKGEDRSKDKAGKAHTFNSRALSDAEQPIFIVEGEIDAMSIIEVGGEAVGLCSTAFYKMFLQEVKERKPKQPLIIALDSDTPGQKTQAKLEEELHNMAIPFLSANINGKYKDANEFLTSDREGLKKTIRETIARCRREAEQMNGQTETQDTQAKEDIKADKVKASEERQMQNGKKSNAEYINEFLGSVKAFADTPEQSTGFKCLDNCLDGGLYEGLYTIGAISSLGKTSFVLQMCDQIARAGKHILFFSMEMARLELMAKSISRETFLNAKDRTLAKDVRHIMNGKLVKRYTPEERELITTAISEYASYSDNIFIQEGVGDITVKRIEETVKEHIREHKTKPIVVLDYLQIVAPEEKDLNRTDKQITDNTIVALKRLSRDEKLTIIAISSFNRENYTEPVGYASFKESGSVEYSSDVLIGLQYRGMDYKTTRNTKGELTPESNTQHIARIRELVKNNDAAARRGEAVAIEVKILKNRNGYKSTQLLSYYPKYNTFTEESIPEEPEAPGADAEQGNAPTRKERGHKW